MRYALMTEPQQGLSYDEILAIARTAEQAGIEAHMQHLRANADKLLGAGRFGHATDAAATDRAVGLVIVTASSQSEAEALFAADPAVSSGLMKITVRRWEARRLKAY